MAVPRGTAARFFDVSWYCVLCITDESIAERNVRLISLRAAIKSRVRKK